MSEGYSEPAVAGTGAIALGVAAVASTIGPVRVLARSDESAERAAQKLAKSCERIEGADAERIAITTQIAELAGADVVVEAIVENAGIKVEMHKALAEACPEADLATTTSSLGIAELGQAIGVPERFYGLHVFNPVARMDLVELCVPDEAGAEVAGRARAFCEALGKKAVDVPDVPGFVVNRLLFAYLFDAVRLLESTGMPPEDVDACMKMGAGHPMGPLGLLDFVGIDVSVAIGEQLYADTGEERHRPPQKLAELLESERLGRKAGAGFFDYD